VFDIDKAELLCIYYVYILDMKKEKTLITLRVNEETLEKWDLFCKNQELRRSDLIRTAVNNFITSSSGQAIETLIDDLLHNYTRNLSKKIVQDVSLTMIHEFDRLKLFIQENK
jgi:hypothetical protein